MCDVVATVAVSELGAGAGSEDGEVIVRLRIPPPVTSQPQPGHRLTLHSLIH